jgi:hypothetical protein
LRNVVEVGAFLTLALEIILHLVRIFEGNGVGSGEEVGEGEREDDDFGDGGEEVCCSFC